MVLNQSIKHVISETPPQAIATYDFFDLGSGKGIKTFYAGDYNFVSATQSRSYVINPNIFFSDIGSTTTSGGDVIAFDMTLNRSLLVQGETIINVPFMFHSTTGTILQTNIIGEIQKVSGGTPTTLGSGTTFKRKTVGLNDTVPQMAAIAFEMNKTNFKKNDILRLNVISSGSYTGGANSVIIGHDPAGRTAPADIPTSAANAWSPTSALTIQLPLVVDI